MSKCFGASRRDANLRNMVIPNVEYYRGDVGATVRIVMNNRHTDTINWIEMLFVIGLGINTLLYR